MRTKTGKDGFTLIELMIVIAIVGVMAAIALPNLLAWIPDMRLKGAARDLYSDFQKARITAVKENKDVRIRFDYTAGTVGYYYFDTDNDSIHDAGEYRRDMSTYKSGVAFPNSAPVNCGGTTTNWSSSAITQAPVITFSSTGTANSGSVYIENQNKDICYSVTSQVYGAVKLRRAMGGSW